jgi:signal transduction histidine kinase
MLEVVVRTTGMGFAAIAHVTPEKWVACAVKDEIAFGLQPGGELKLETTICNEIRQSGREVVIDHVSADPEFCDHHTPKLYGFQSYISIPIVLAGGEFFGTLCAIDPEPRKLNNPAILGMFRLFAGLISLHLDGLRNVQVAETRLLEERKTAKWREQFIAMLGHDLRSPLTAITSGAQLLLRLAPGEEIRQLAAIIEKSATRMNLLVADTYDFARGKLGGGLAVIRTTDRPFEDVLNQVIDEQQIATPNANIVRDFELTDTVCFDSVRIAQLFSNVLGNAVKYGDNTKPITVNAVSKHNKLTLSITNAGSQIPENMLEHIFEPFSRGDAHPGQHGLGLGLYIAAEIARAHNGNLAVTSNDNETTFILTMPCA